MQVGIPLELPDKIKKYKERKRAGCNKGEDAKSHEINEIKETIQINIFQATVGSPVSSQPRYIYAGDVF